MGESKEEILKLDFDRRLKLGFHGSKVTSDAGLLPYRELDDAVGLTEIVGAVLADTRRRKNGRHGLVGHFRQSVFGRLGGYDDVNGADRLSLDPVRDAVLVGAERWNDFPESGGVWELSDVPRSQPPFFKYIECLR